MNDIDTCQHGLKPQCPEFLNPIMIDFLALVDDKTVTMESIDALNAMCKDCTSFTPKE